MRATPPNLVLQITKNCIGGRGSATLSHSDINFNTQVSTSSLTLGLQDFSRWWIERDSNPNWHHGFPDKSVWGFQLIMHNPTKNKLKPLQVILR